jgi:hypothetical protein
MGTWWDEFIDQLKPSELADVSPRKLCEMFYAYLLGKGRMS